VRWRVPNYRRASNDLLDNVDIVYWTLNDYRTVNMYSDLKVSDGPLTTDWLVNTNFGWI
jgi:hypothetical protein